MTQTHEQTSEMFNQTIEVESLLDSDFKLALQDMVSGITNYKFWAFMGISEIRRRYRRTFIGPFWTTISLGIFIGCMGYLLSTIWHNNPKEFLPYFCSGYICWMLVQSIILESCTTFTSSEAFIRQVSLPYTIYSCLISWRNMVIFFHHLIILAIVLWYADVPLNLNFALVIPGLIITFVTGVWLGVFIGMICARFRDIQQIIISFLQLAMFVTPIMWKPEQLGSKAIWISTFNPLNHFINIIRAPLIGEAPGALSWGMTLGFSVVGALLTLAMLSKNYRRLVFWL